MKKCYICGSTKDLVEVENIKMKKGKREYFIGNGYVCKSCEK
jgi:hypothetical protein